MDNQQISIFLEEMADAWEYLDEPFRAMAYRKASKAVSGLSVPARTLLADNSLKDIRGIGKGISTAIASWQNGDFTLINELSSRLPSGFNELIRVPGFGMKRIRELKEQGIETLEDLRSALHEGGLSSLKGFTPRFTARIGKAIDDIISSRGQVLINRALQTANNISDKLMENGVEAHLTGELRRAQETTGRIDFLVADMPGTDKVLQNVFKDNITRAGDSFVIKLKNAPEIWIHLSDKKAIALNLFMTTGSKGHVELVLKQASRLGYEITGNSLALNGLSIIPESEEAFYKMLGMGFIEPEIREGLNEVELALSGRLPKLIASSDIKGTIHNHTTYSDGRASLAEMAHAAQNLGYEWIGIADHSISARYANGMQEKEVSRQHSQIDELNLNQGIKILKGVECDILPDGSCDYATEALKTFDFIIASIHTSMDMDEKAMTERMIKAVRNPFVSMLAHPSGRLLLARSPYEVDLDAVLEECLLNRVTVEINSNPMRLDLDWRRAEEFATAGGIIALSPDAHDLSGLEDMRYGLMMARKAKLKPKNCINSFKVEDALAILKKNR